MAERITFTLDSRAVFDGGNDEEVRAVAGDQFAGRDGDALIVKGTGGRPERMTAGWVVYRVVSRDGKPAAQATVCSPEAWADMGGPQTAAVA